MSYQNVPFGVRLLQKASACCCPRLRFNRALCYRFSVLALTYMAYMCYHLSRKPISVVKTVLHRNCSQMEDDWQPHNSSTWCDWAPFDGSDADASTLLGMLDSSFLIAYAIAMFASGFVAERVDLRYFLSLGMILSGAASYLFGIARTYNIHSLWYFILVQIFGGVAQTTGWPGVVTVVGNWFGKSKRGLIYGIWNSHTSIGNILGTLIAAGYVETNWGDSFIVPGLIIAGGGALIFAFLVVHPSDINLSPANDENKRKERRMENRVANNSPQSNNTYYAQIQDDSEESTDDAEVLGGEQEVQRRHTERTHLLSHGPGGGHEERAIGFLGACRIPGVIEYSLSLFFSKLVSYTFMYWLPLYLSASTKMGATFSADMSIVFDVGGIFGAIAAGVISDSTGMSAFTCVVMLLAAAPMMFIYQHFSTISFGVNIFLLILVGLLVNGPYALITTAVSAELGTHASLKGDAKALATVTAIIDGTGSVGAAIGPFLAGYVSSYGWHNVFYMLISSDIIALLLLLRLVRQEVHRYKDTRRSHGLVRIE